MQIRPAHTTDAAAVNELIHQLGYGQDGTATTATRIPTWGADPTSAAYVAEADGDLRGCVRMEVTNGDRRQDAHEFYRRCSCVDQRGRSSRFLRDLNDTNPS